MHSMADHDDCPSDDNVHVKELKRLFISCNSDKNGLINKENLILLCEKLNLSDVAESVADRVLCNESAVNFKQFKDQFLTFLPEIIDLSTGNPDELMIAAHKTCSGLEIKDTQRLSRYDVHAMCETTPELELLSVLDINAIFDKGSVSGRISLVNFIAQYRARQKTSEEIHFIADSYLMASVNLFENLDTDHKGETDSSVVIDYLTNCGLKLDEAISLLKEFGQSTSTMIGLVGLGNYLESSLSHMLSSAPVSSRAGFLCMKSLIDSYRCTNRELELRCEHQQKQLQIANQRRNMLIDELDQNQESIEASYNNQLKEMEERCRSRIAVMEEKYRFERTEMQKEIETIEKNLSVIRHNETSLRNKLQLIERHNKRITSELEDQTDTINSLEKENRELRSEIRKKQQFRLSEDNSKIIAWKQKVELMVAHNKRLREKLQDISKHSKCEYSLEERFEKYVQWTAPFRSQLLLINQRRARRRDKLSEMDSEPESIFYRKRQKRLRKKKDRMKRYNMIHNLQAGNIRETEEFASNSFSENGRKSILSPRNRDMLINLKDSDSSDRKLIARAKNDERHKSITAAFEEVPNVNNYEVEIKILQNTIAAQKQMYEGQILNLSRKVASLQNSESKDATSRFYSLFEKYRYNDTQSNSYQNQIGVEKGVGRTRMSPSLCSRCTVIEPKINELHLLVGGPSRNFTVEDPVHTIANQDKSYLQSEIGRLKARISLARSKVAEVLAIMALPGSSTRNYLQNPEVTTSRSAPYSTRSHRSFADLRERIPNSERTELTKDSVIDPSQFSSNLFQKHFP